MLTMNDQRARRENMSLKQIEKFLAASKEVRFESNHRVEVYGWIERLLSEQEYTRQAP